MTHRLNELADDIRYCTEQARQFSDLACRVAFKGNAMAAAHYEDIARVFAKRAMSAARAVSA